MKTNLTKHNMKYIKLFEEYNVSTDVDIKSVMNSYLESAIWTEEERIKEEENSEYSDMYGDNYDDIDNEDSSNVSIKALLPQTDFSIDNIADDSKIHAYYDIKKFLEYAGDAVKDIDASSLGHDIWLTRNHHGAGFFDRGYDSDVEKILMDSAHKLGEDSLYLGDDGYLHFEKE